jgi:cell division septation protein DedD
MSDDRPRRGLEDQDNHDSPFPWMQGELEEEIAPPFRPWMIAVAAASMAIVIVAIWYAWSAGQSDMDSPPPIVQADRNPVKVAPDEPGGMEVPHQDNEVFSAIEDAPREPVEELLPPPEEPVDLPDVAIPETAPPPTQQAASEPASQTPAPAESKPAETTPPKTETAQTETANIEPEPKPTPPPAPKAEPAPTASSTAASSGQYVVQLAALQSRDAATDAWARLVKKHTRLLAPLTLDIEPVNVAGKGTFYRMRGAGFATRAEAEKRCADLKAAGQACLVKAR